MIQTLIKSSLFKNTSKLYLKQTNNFSTGYISFCFSNQKKKTQIPASMLSEEEIKQTLKPEEYAELQLEAQKLQEKCVKDHKNLISKLEIDLSLQQRQRLLKINKLLNGLNAQQAQYIQYKLLKSVEL